MEGNERHHAEQGTARDQERLLLLARLHHAGPVESLITQLVGDSMGTSVALTPGIEDALSASADEAAAAGEGAQGWQAQQATWVNGGPCDANLPHADAPVRALLHDPTVVPVEIGQAAVRALYPALLRAGVRAYGRYGRSVVLVDLL